MTAHTVFCVDLNSTITPRASFSIDDSTGVPTMQTVDGGGNPVSTVVGGGGGGGGTPANAISPKAASTGAIGASTNYARQDHVHPVNTGVDVGLINATQLTQIGAGATTAILNSGKSALKDPGGGADIPLGGNVATTWQTYTPSATNTVHIAIDRASGPNVMLASPADNTQVVDVPLNMADGAEMQINLIGGGASGSWTAWSSGTPTTPGWVFLNGAAPTAPASATNYLRIIAKRRGFKYECDIAAFNANAIV